MTSERRRFRRRAPKEVQHAVVSLQLPGCTPVRLSAQIKDLSLGGCRVAVRADALPSYPGAPASLVFPVNGKPLVLAATLVASTFVERVGMHVCRFKFMGVTTAQSQQLAKALLSQNFMKPDVLRQYQHHWAAPQWGAHLTAQALPVLQRSKDRFAALAETGLASQLSNQAFEEIVNEDPFLCLAILREAERVRSRRLGHDTTTVHAAVMHLGVDRLQDLMATAPAVVETHGLMPRIDRAVTAGRLASAWAKSRVDVEPAEISIAALLAETGELLLWHFAPDLPQAADELALANLGEMRTADAQLTACGFTFRDLTLQCAEAWGLPRQVLQLIRGQDTTRANLARLCVDVIRHLEQGGASHPSLPNDIAIAALLLPFAHSTDELVEHLPGLMQDERAYLAEAAREILAAMKQPGRRCA